MGHGNSKACDNNKASNDPGGPSLPAGAVGGKSKTSVVDSAGVMARQGRISVTGRYVTDRPLSADFNMDSKVLGSGMSGPVQLARSIDGGHRYAVKSFKKKGLNSRKRIELKSEVEIYMQLDHPHIASLECVYEGDEEIHIVMELMAGGELYDRLSEQKRYAEEAAAQTTHQMLLAVAYLHAHQVAHRDLKLENFLYESTTTDHLKLIDFGFAKFWDHSTKMSQACGSVHYVAPEVLSHAYNEKADLWSLGVIVYMLLLGSPPFHGTDDEVLRKIRTGQPHWPSRFQKLSEPAQDFVKHLLVLDPTVRFSAPQALGHEFMSKRTKMQQPICPETLNNLRKFAHASSFRRAVLSMMAWSLNTEDRMELREMFLSLDTENRGTITHTQMAQLLQDNFDVGSAEAEKLFRTLDANNDNEISYSEFLAAALEGRVKVHEDLLRKTFGKFDVDGNQTITKDELRKILGDHFEDVQIEALIAEVDTNGDGNIQYDEFIQFFYTSKAAVVEDGVVDVTPAKSIKSCKSVSEKMGAFIDKLVKEEEANILASPQSVASTPAGSPSSRTPKPLARRPSKSKTAS